MASTTVGTNHGGGDADGSITNTGDTINNGATLDLSSLQNVSYQGHTINEGLQGADLQNALTTIVSGTTGATMAGISTFTNGIFANIKSILNSDAVKYTLFAIVGYFAYKFFKKRGKK